MVKKLLLVDGDDMVRAALQEQLQAREEFEVAAFPRAGDGLRHARARHVDLALLDAVLPDMDGREMCRRLRREGMRAPVLLFAAAPAAEDAEDAADAADGHVAKPFRLRVLLARIRAQLRRHERDENAGLRIGPWRFRPGARLLQRTAGADSVRLTEKEAAILQYLHRAGGRPVSRDELLHEVWGYSSEAETRTLEAHVHRLRRKIGAAPGGDGLVRAGAGSWRLAVRERP